MPQWMLDLIAGWPMIMANIPTFIVIVILIAGLVWAAMSWAHGSIIRKQAAEIKLLERQKAEAAVAITKPNSLKEGAPQVADVQRLVKGPRLEWEAGGRVSLQGRYSRPGGPVSVYVIYSLGGTLHFRAQNTVLGGANLAVEPRIKVDALDHFDGDEKADLTLGFVTSDNGLILQWGQPQQNKTKIGITFGSYFGAVILVWNEGKNEESYPFAIIPTYQTTDQPGALRCRP